MLRRVIGHADLTESGNGVAQQIPLGTLPAGARVIGRSVNLNTFFTGGGATTCTMSIGTTTDPDSVMAALSVLDTTTNDIPLQGTSGVSPVGPYTGALVAEFDADAGHNLLALTAGEITVEIYFVTPDDNSTLA